jgi:signal transduction histidine kinase
MSPQPSGEFSHAKRHRRGIRKPRPSDVRMMISLPALVVLLVMGMGLAEYIVCNDFAEKAATLYPDADVSSIFRSSFIVLIAFIAVALVSSIALAWTLLRPIRQLADAAATITRGDIRPDLHIPGSPFEIDQLGKTFNSMVDFINAMIEQRELYLTEGAQTGSLILSVRRRVTMVNAAGLGILDVRREDLMGKALADFRREFPDAAPSFFEWCAAQLERIEAASQGETEIAARGNEKSLIASTSLLRDERNAPSALLVNFRDASVGKNLDVLFTGTDQLAALGTFTFGLAHELRNPLGALKGSAQLLGERIAGQEDAAPYVRRIVHEVNRLDRVIQELYDFSHAPVGPPEPCDLSAIAHKGLLRAQLELPENLRAGKSVVEEYAGNLPRVVAQSDRILRAISNVVVNAFEAAPAGGELRLKTGLLPSEENGPESPAGATAAHPVFLDVVNTGAAIPKENLQKIFEPFFSTKPGRTGLGLAIAYQIVSQNRGRLSVSHEQEGAVCFRFLFRMVRDSED